MYLVGTRNNKVLDIVANATKDTKQQEHVLDREYRQNDQGLETTTTKLKQKCT